MAPRKYRSERRAQAQEQTRIRIIEATVHLHGEKGVLATSYADIAREADVALPTVYKHFPTREDLVSSCTAHAASSAPLFGPEIYSSLSRTDERLRALTEATFRLHAYFARWMRWGEHRQIPEIRESVEESQKHLRQMLALACSPDGPRDRLEEFMRAALLLLSYGSWENLTSDQQVSPSDAAELISRSLVALLNDFTRLPPSA